MLLHLEIVNSSWKQKQSILPNVVVDPDPVDLGSVLKDIIVGYDYDVQYIVCIIPVRYIMEAIYWYGTYRTC